jgi:hypothetical protein
MSEIIKNPFKRVKNELTIENDRKNFYENLKLKNSVFIQDRDNDPNYFQGFISVLQKQHEDSWRKIVKIPSINRNFVDLIKMEELRSSSSGSEPFDLDPETEVDYQKSRTADQLEKIRESPTSILKFNLLDINTATILMRRNK